LASNRAIAKLQAFLETTPPNCPARIPGVATLKYYQDNRFHWVAEVVPKRLQLHCDVDDGVRRFELDASASNRLGVGFRFLAYSCRDCRESTKTYALVTELKPVNAEGRESRSDVEVMKLGEFPPFGAPIARRIQKLLDTEDLELYRKGSRSEAQGLGIGAATYFRRIVERRWKLLVRELRSAAAKLGHADLAVFDDALRETQFSAAVRTLRGAMPDKLLILNGQNPLTLLHSALSVQLHGLTDEQCLQQAADIRVVLTALLENIADVLKDQEELRSAADRLKKIRRPT
jgi:hypothetical protein